MSTPQLRPYQKEAADALLKTKSGIAVEPTGSGKSLILAEVVRQAAPCLIMQPSQEVLASNIEKLHNFGFTDTAIYSAGAGSKRTAAATFATIGSIVKGDKVIQPILDLKPKKLLIDECHLVSAQGGQYKALIEQLGCDVLGLTASPFRLHTISDLGSYRTRSGYYTGKVSDIRILTRTRPRAFKQIVHITQSSDLIEQGFLHEPEFFVSGRDARSQMLLNSSGAEYSDQSITKLYRKTDIKDRIITATADAIRKGFKRILVFVPLLKESDELVRRMQRLGVEAENIDGETPKAIREDRIRGFKAGRIRVMINVGTLTTGVDIPELDCIIGGRPTMSLGLYYQMLGRCVRPHPDKKRVAVFDLVDNYGKFGNPFRMRLTHGRRGLHYILGEGGRLTGRDMALGPECEDVVDFGKFAGTRLCDLPMDYLQWLIENNKPCDEVEKYEAEIQRREMIKSKGPAACHRPGQEAEVHGYDL